MAPQADESPLKQFGFVPRTRFEAGLAQRTMGGKSPGPPGLWPVSCGRSRLRLTERCGRDSRLRVVDLRVNALAGTAGLRGRLTTMQRKVIISCAVTGSADSPGKNPAVPVTPEQIAQSCDRRRQGRRRRRSHPRARPQDHQAEHGRRALSRGGRAHPGERHRRADQPDHRARARASCRSRGPDQGRARLARMRGPGCRVRHVVRSCARTSAASTWAASTWATACSSTRPSICRPWRSRSATSACCRNSKCSRPATCSSPRA